MITYINIEILLIKQRQNQERILLKLEINDKIYPALYIVEGRHRKVTIYTLTYAYLFYYKKERYNSREFTLYKKKKINTPEYLLAENENNTNVMII